MNKLESIYENKIIFPPFLERKIKITDKYTILIGTKASGKSNLIYDYLNTYNEYNYLYIDLDDYKIQYESFKHLQKFIDTNNIKILVIENYNTNIELPNVDSIILSSKSSFNIVNFSYLNVYPLDFEEFILFDTKHQNITNSFNSFLKYGNIPEIIEYKEHKKQLRNKELLELYEKNPTALEILKLLIKSAGEVKSPFWLYGILKKDMKISKDFFYKKMKEYEDSSIIFLCEKFNQPKATKKIFCFNHALIDIVSYNKKFINNFSNMIYLELHAKSKNIFYLDNIDFYIPGEKRILLCLPFFNKVLFSNLSAKILKSIYNVEIDNIVIITINNHDDNIYIDNIHCEILPFYEWALSN